MEKEIKRHVMQVLCILCAVALWMYVIYTEDPEMSVWMRNIPVSYVGNETLTERGLTFVERTELTQINVKVTGRRSSLTRLQDSEIRAMVDYSAITGTGNHTLPISVSIAQNDVRVTKLSASTVTCKTDALVTVDKTVTVTTSGAEALGIHDLTASPSTVRVTGPESILTHLTAKVHIDFGDGEISDSHIVSLSDQSGKFLWADSVTMESDSVTVSATRSLDVKLEAANLPEGVEITETVYNPETVDVRGALSDLVALEDVRGAYSVWVDFSSSPAKSGQVYLSYPEGVEQLGPSHASAEFHFE
ncbi:MAG: hypothetical protein E7390_00175 [Ruminococcaceae bacterium]|nr:hypothetical protein [Oscillospiraceae bacterium]